MITAPQYCQAIVDEAEDLTQDIGESSKLAVAKEYLNLLTDHRAIRYAATRAGLEIYYVHPTTGKSTIITAREIIQLLEFWHKGHEFIREFQHCVMDESGQAICPCCNKPGPEHGQGCEFLEFI